MKLEALGNDYKLTAFWEDILCNTSPNSSCWLSECEDCKHGKKFEPAKQPQECTTYRQWETILKESSSNTEENSDADGGKKQAYKKLQCITTRVYVGAVLDELKASLPDV